MDRVLDEQLRDYLPLIESTEANAAEYRKLEFDNSSSTAATLSRPSVLAHPNNVAILFDQQWSRAKLAQTSPLSEWRKYQRYRAQLRFQQRLSEKMIEALKSAGLADWIITVYETRKILNRANPELPPWNLTTLLLESKNSRELQKRLQQLNQAAGIQSLNEVITTSWQAIQKSPDRLLREHLYSFMRDFSRYRRDLQLLYKYHHAANQVELLQDESSIQTSRANYTLYEFLLQKEKQIENAAIRSHIIIKADLRGSTEVTERLNQLALNPATHFDRNFFSPINNVINDYGAEKVFIEGDAIILILNDYAGSQHSHLIASRACGLAAGILEVVAKQNRELRCYGLPELELGIGIAYSDESPRFLFDGDHKITISPAINRADRLSACAWGVRNWRERLQAPETHVEVYQPSAGALAQGEKAQKDLVYNLNGILMEPEVFELLQKEISPRRIVNKLPNMQESRLFAIKVAGSDGVSHSLIVRRAPIKIYDPEYGLNDCPTVEGRYFYELIYDRGIIDSLRKRPNGSTT
jgi:class 3 adenylate cyclase